MITVSAKAEELDLKRKQALALLTTVIIYLIMLKTKKMKKIFQLSLLCLVLLATACKKEASPIAAVATVSNFQPQPEAESTGSAANGEWAEPNGAVKLTNELNDALEAGEAIFVKEVAEHHYIGEVVATPQTALSYVSCNRAMDRFTHYYNTNKANFLAWANANCQPYIANYLDPCGKKILFMVKPDAPDCGAVYIPNQNCWTYYDNGGWMYMSYTWCIHD
jgi:hypothetical protein